MHVGTAQDGNLIKEKIKVSGNCEMCKTTIEKAANSVDGVKMARWNPETKMLKVKFYEGTTDLDEIQKAIATVGYDTEKYKATDEVYNALHHCCQYERDLY
jgi:copper chaperone CopZ